MHDVGIEFDKFLLYITDLTHFESIESVQNR